MTIFDKLVGHRFTSLVDCYVATKQVEANLDMKSVERARACDPSDSDNRKDSEKKRRRKRLARSWPID